jgi:YVTN family beta-propeller protein
VTWGRPLPAPNAMALGYGSLWGIDLASELVMRIAPRTNHVTATIRVGHRPQGIVVASGMVWVTVRA